MNGNRIKPTRRAFLLGGGALIAAPAIVRFENLMPVRNRLVVPEPDLFADPLAWRAWMQRTECEIYREFVRHNRFVPYTSNL